MAWAVDSTHGYWVVASINNSNPVDTDSITTPTLGDGDYIIILCILSPSGDVGDSMTMHWDPTGNNEAMTAVLNEGANGNIISAIFYLENPQSHNGSYVARATPAAGSGGPPPSHNIFAVVFATGGHTTPNSPDSEAANGASGDAGPITLTTANSNELCVWLTEHQANTEDDPSCDHTEFWVHSPAGQTRIASYKIADSATETENHYVVQTGDSWHMIGAAFDAPAAAAGNPWNYYAQAA
jgi:hypothetical protein